MMNFPRKQLRKKYQKQLKIVYSLPLRIRKDLRIRGEKNPNLNTACQLLSTVNNNHLNTGNKNNNIFNRFSKI